ncbi:hypothetical protein N7512_001799 [Penicillium capsulatum]|nr:hypothetical protein N7512_001799 [Penicillium capsulatum]
MIFANSVLAIKGSPNFKGDNFSFFQNFPYSEQPNCPVWFSTKNPKQYWVDSRCPFNPEEWEKSQPSTTMQGWPTPIYEPHGPSTTQHLGPVETVNIKDLPRDLSKTGPPRHPTWVGLYRKNKDDKRCLIWLHDVLNNGLDLSVPIGVYNATAGRCHGFGESCQRFINTAMLMELLENDYRRHQAQISPGTYVTLYYQDDPRWAVTKGMFTIESRQSYQYFILGNQIGCQGFAQNQTEFEKEVYFIKKGCDSISHYANVEIWDPAKG